MLMKLRCVSEPEVIEELEDAGFRVDDVFEFPNVHPCKLSGVLLEIPIGTVIWTDNGYTYLKTADGIRFRIHTTDAGRWIEAA